MGTIATKRNAAVGWVTIKAGKHLGKKKSRDGIVKKLGIASAVAAVGGAIFFWRKKAGSSPPTDETPAE